MGIQENLWVTQANYWLSQSRQVRKGCLNLLNKVFQSHLRPFPLSASRLSEILNPLKSGFKGLNIINITMHTYQVSRMNFS